MPAMPDNPEARSGDAGAFSHCEYNESKAMPDGPSTGNAYRDNLEISSDRLRSSPMSGSMIPFTPCSALDRTSSISNAGRR
jgi:hypothetical protein